MFVATGVFVGDAGVSVTVGGSGVFVGGAGVNVAVGMGVGVDVGSGAGSCGLNPQPVSIKTVSNNFSKKHTAFVFIIYSFSLYS